MIGLFLFGELVSPSLREADSLYALLAQGADPDARFRQGASTCDIMKYPPSVREELRGLKHGDFTRPIRLGVTYVVHKRF